MSVYSVMPHVLFALFQVDTVLGSVEKSYIEMKINEHA